MASILISAKDFAEKDLIAENIEVSGFDLVVRATDGKVYIINDGLSSALMGDLVIKQLNKPDLDVDTVLDITKKAFTGIESEYFANALKSYGTTESKNSHKFVGNSEQGSDEPVSAAQESKLEQEIKETQEQINELNDELAGAMAARGLTDKISELLKQKDLSIENSEYEAPKNFNTANAKNTEDPIILTIGADPGKKELKVGDDRDPLSGMFDARQFYVTGLLADSSQVITPSGIKIPNFTSESTPTLTGTTFSNATVVVKLHKVGEDPASGQIQTIKPNSKGIWTFIPNHSLGYGKWEANVISSLSGELDKKTDIGFEVIPPSTGENLGFTAVFDYENATYKSIDPKDFSYALVGNPNQNVSGVAVPGSLIRITDSYTDPTNTDPVTNVYSILVPVNGAPDPINPDSGLVQWSFPFNGILGKEFTNKSKHKVDIINIDSLGQESPAIEKKFTVDSSTAEVDLEITLVDTYATETATTPVVEGQEERKSFIAYGTNNDKITSDVEGLKFKIYVEDTFAAKLKATKISANKADTMKFNMNGITLDISQDLLKPSTTKAGYKEMEITPVSIGLNTANMKQGDYHYVLTATNMIGAAKVVQGVLKYDYENKGVDTFLSAATDTAVTSDATGQIYAYTDSPAVASGKKLIEVSNADKVKFTTSSTSDKITRDQNVEIIFADFVPTDVMRFTLKKSTITDGYETEADNIDYIPPASTFVPPAAPAPIVMTDDELSLPDEDKVVRLAEIEKENAAAMVDYNAQVIALKKAFDATLDYPDIHSVYFKINETGGIEDVPGKRALTEEDKERLTFKNGVLSYKTSNKLAEGKWISKVESVDLAGNTTSKEQEIVVDREITLNDTVEDLVRNPIISGITEPNSYVVLTTYDTAGNPIIASGGLAPVKSTLKEASRAILADANGKWLMSYAIDGGKLPTGVYKYQVTSVDVVGNMNLSPMKQFEVTGAVDNSRALDEPYLVGYNSDGTEKTKNLLDKKQDAVDLINTLNATSNRADVVFAGSIVDKNGATDVLVDGTPVVFAIYLDDKRTNQRTFNGVTDKGNWKVEIPHGEIKDGIYFYKVSVDTGIGTVTKESTFQMDVMPPDLDLSYYNSALTSKIGTTEVLKVTKPTEATATEYKQAGSSPTSTIEKGFGIMTNDLNGKIKFKTEGFSSGKIIFTKDDGAKVEEDLIISAVGDGSCELPEEIKTYLQIKSKETASAGVGKITFKFELTDSAKNSATYGGGIFFAPAAIAEIESPAFTLDSNAPVQILGDAKIVTGGAGGSSYLSTSDWGLQDKYYTADREPTIAVNVTNVKQYQIEGDDRIYIVDDGFKGRATLSNDTRKPYQLNGERNSETDDALARFNAETVFPKGLTRLNVNTTIKDNFGNDLNPTAQQLMIYSAEPSSTIQTLDESSVPTPVNMNVNTANPFFKFTVTKSPQGNLLPEDSYNQVWIKVALDSPVDSPLAQVFNIKGNSLTVKAQEFNAGKPLDPGIHNIYYRVYDAWGNFKDYIEPLSVKSSTIELANESDSGVIGDNITNVASPIIYVSTGLDTAKQVFVYIGNRVFAADQDTTDRQWKVDLNKAREVVFKVSDTSTMTSDEIISNISSIGDPTVVKLPDGKYGTSALIIDGSTTSRAYNNLEIDTSAPISTLITYSTGNAMPSSNAKDIYFLKNQGYGIHFDIQGDFDFATFAIPELEYRNSRLIQSAGSTSFYNTGSLNSINSTLWNKYANKSKPVKGILTVSDAAGNTSSKEFDIYLPNALPKMSFGNDTRPAILDTMTDDEKEIRQQEIDAWDENHLRIDEVSGNLPVISSDGQTELNFYGVPGTTLKIFKDGSSSPELSQIFPADGVIEGHVVNEDSSYRVVLDYTPVRVTTESTFTVINEDSADATKLTVSLTDEDHTGDIEQNGKQIMATTARNPDFKGTAPASANVKIIIDGLPENTYHVRSNSSGNWSLTLDDADLAARLNSGYHFVNVTSVSLLGKVGKSVTEKFYIDVSTPILQIGFAKQETDPSLSSLITNQATTTVIKGNLPNNLKTVDISYTVAGTVTVVGKLTWNDTTKTWDSSDTTHTVIYDADTGNFTLKGLDFTAMANKGAVSFDVIGKTATGAKVDVSLILKLDTTPPAEPTGLVLSDQIYQSASHTSKTSIKQIIIKGMSNDPEAFAKASFNGKTYTTFVLADGSFYIPINSEDVIKGNNSIQVRVVDFAGNESREENYTFDYESNLLTISSYFPKSIDASDTTKTFTSAAFAPTKLNGIDFEVFEVKGKVLDSENNPVDKATVTLSIAGFEIRTTTASDGTYTITDKVPRGLGDFKYNLVAVKDAASSLTRSGSLVNKNIYKLFGGGLKPESDDGTVGDNITTIKDRSKLKLEGQVDHEYANVTVKVNKFGDSTNVYTLNATIKDGKWSVDLNGFGSKQKLDIGAYQYTVSGDLKTTDISTRIVKTADIKGTFLINEAGVVTLYTSINDSHLGTNKLTYGENNENVFLTDPVGKVFKGIISGGATVKLSVYFIDPVTSKETLFVEYTPTDISSTGEFSQSLDQLPGGVYKIITTAVSTDTELGEVTKEDKVYISASVAGDGIKDSLTAHLTPETDTGPSNNDGYTRIIDPVLTGIATPFALVEVTPARVGSDPIYAVADELGKWKAFNVPSVSGTNSVSIKATDISGVETTTTYQYNVSQTGVQAKSVAYSASNGGEIVITKEGDGVGIVKASIVGKDGKTIEKVIYFDQSIPGTGTDIGGGEYQFKLPFKIPDLNANGRTIHIEAFVQDQYGNYSAPIKTTIYGFSAGINNGTDKQKDFNEVTYIQDGVVKIDGEGNPGGTVILEVKNSAGATQFTTSVVVGVNGKWTWRSPTEMNPGERYNYIATNDSNVEITGNFEIQKGVPEITSVNFVQLGDTRENTDVPTSASGGKNYFASGTAVVTGKLSQKGIVKVTITSDRIDSDGNKVLDGSGKPIKDVQTFESATDNSGGWVIAVSGLNKQGSYDYKVNAESFSGLQAVKGVIDGLITVKKLESGNVRTISDGDLNEDKSDQSFVFKGNVDKSSSVVFTLIDKATGSTIFTSNTTELGDFSIRVPKGILPFGHTEYTYHIYSIGNESNVKSADVTIPSTKFVIQGALEIEEEAKSVADSLGYALSKTHTSTTTPTIKGYAAPNAEVTVTIAKLAAGSAGGTISTPIEIKVQADSIGRWSVTIPSDTPLDAAKYTYTAKQKGVVSADTTSAVTGTIIVDNNKPENFTANVVTTFNTYKQNLSLSTATTANQTTVNDVTPTVFGQVPAGSTAIITYEGKEYPAFTNADGRFVFNLPSQKDFVAGPHTFKLNAINQAGVKGDAVDKVFTIDTNGIDNTPPTITSVDIKNGDNYVYNLAAPLDLQFKGQVSELSNILLRVKLNGVTIAEKNINTAAGDWEIKVDGTKLSPTFNYSYEISATDPSGNRSATKSGTFKIEQSTGSINEDQSTILDNHILDIPSADFDV